MQNHPTDTLAGRHFDVAIVGAGINGASAAQHLAAAGYKVLIVDQGDFANGASGRSSRLLHCGLRHLATGTCMWSILRYPLRLARSLGTVRADMLARDDIVRTLPERVIPMKFCLPIYNDDPYAPWQIDAAFSMLRLTSPGGVPLDYRRYRKSELDQVPIAPWLRNHDKLLGVAVFREYIFDWPERIALDALFDARSMNATVHNYTRVEKLRLADDGAWHLSLRSDGWESTAMVSANVVLNLSGAWVDQVTESAGGDATRKCQPIKGIHIAVQLPDEFSSWGVFTYNSFGEPLYCLPWRGIHYVGLTRTPFSGDASGVAATDDELDWMVAEANRCLPKLELTRASVLYSWAGVNPLTHDAAQPLGSRDIQVHDLSAEGSPNMFVLTGGPIMTHRRVANQLLRAVSRVLHPSGARKGLHILPASAQLDSQPNTFDEQVAHCARIEMPRTLDDLMMRRLGLGWDPDQGVRISRRVANIAAPVLGWPQSRVEQEIADYARHLRTHRRS